MNLFRVLEDAFIFYILYKIVFSFIIPLVQTTKQVKTKVNDLNRHMQEQQQAAEARRREYTQARPTETRPSADDYIEYEEVK